MRTKQVNVMVTEEEYIVLVREAGKRMAETGKVIQVASLAYELLKPVISNLRNGAASSVDSEQDNIQEDEQEASVDDKQSKFDWSQID